MKMRLLLVAFVLGISIPAHAHEKGKLETRKPDSEFRLDKGLLDSLYRSATTEASVDTDRYSAGVEITPLISLVNPIELSLTNSYYRASIRDGMPLFQLGLSNLLGYSGNFFFYANFRVGYGYREGVGDVQSQSTGESSRDVVKLHWIPISVAARVAYEVAGMSWLKPSLTVGGGAQYLSRAGKLDGMDQGFWVPFYFGTAAVTLFDLSHRPGEWFGGVTVGATYQDSLSSTQRVRFVSWDVGATLLL